MNTRSVSLPSSLMRSLLAMLLCLPGLAAAHGLLLDAENHGDAITGTLYYSNGELAVREPVELLDLSTPAAVPLTGETDDAGKFSFPVTANHRYRISAYGGEGHGVQVEIDAAVNARPQLIDSGAAADSSSWVPPAWAVIGLLLLVSMVPIFVAKRRSSAGIADG
jgi:hypothetical protein